MTEALGAEKGERTAGRLGYRSGYYGRTLITRIGKLELRVPVGSDRAVLDRAVRAVPALGAGAGGGLAEMYVQGVSTRKVKAITEELCGHSFSASSISAINQRLDASLVQFAGRPLVEAFPYLILDARYERVREAGVIVSQAVLIAIGIDWDGRRQVLALATVSGGRVGDPVLRQPRSIRPRRRGDGVMEATLIVIDSDAELARARALVDRLMASDKPADVARLTAQARLIAAYEEEKWLPRSPGPAEVIRYLMDQHGLTRADLVPLLGSAERVDDILRGRRQLTLAMVQRLRTRFHVPADLLLAPAPRRTATR